MILVTGATGHIGNVLVRKLVELDHNVRILCLPGDDPTQFQLPPVETHYGDIRDYQTVARACEGVDLVYHLAAMISIMPGRSRMIREVNVGGTLNVLQACKEKRVRRLVYTGSVHSFAEPDAGATIDETVPFNPAATSGTYGRSKAEAALFVSTAAREGLDALIVCPTGVIGPFDFKLSLMGSMFLMFIKRKLTMIIDGSFDFVDVRDVVEGLTAAAEKGNRGDVFIVGGEWTTMRGLVEKMAEI
ncbi:MAG TPA: epimerase, partial [Kosmotogaceae bacterium]|nr:epimerase [Kosmotogaceae bacterium]